MLAIPSPDVLLNLFASVGQLFGLLALALGGGAFVKRRHTVGGSAVQPASRWPLYASLGGLVAVSVGFLLYYVHVEDLRNQRLRTNLVRKSTEGSRAVGDVSLKTLAYSGQTKHPRGVDTATLDAWIAEGRALNLVDVREPEEVEMGQVPGTWARRYPDLQADSTGLVVDGKETVLLCESGNRSSELCDWFFARGITTHFLVGGYEKWVAEYRAMTGQRAIGAEIRATPDYPQKNVLLDTPEVLDLVTNHGAVFVDVRYPEDFAREHLPGAINITLRKMLRDEAEAALRALPKRPIIAVCYDKRSSFYGLLLGLRLHRLGADFRGRYTVPHEFTLPVTEATWVAQWQADREGDTLFARVGAGAGVVVGWLADRCGLLLAIVVLVLGLRAAMLPFTLLAERDQWVQRRLSERIRGLRERWAHDPGLWRREAMRLLRRGGVSPLRNVVGALVQIALFAAAFAGVDAVAAGRPANVLWFDLAAADATRLLPILFGAVLVGFVRLQQQDKRRWLLPLLFVAAMVFLVWSCRAAVLIYLIASLGLMAVQTVLQRRWLTRGRRANEPKPAPRTLVPLRTAARHPELGNKAVRLGGLMQAQLPVPTGFVVPGGLHCDAGTLARACAAAGIARAAVRSSAIGEDGAESSCAGMFRSELDVAPADVAAAVERVRASYGGRGGGVVVQEFEPAEYAGVLFTVDPAHAGRMLVEMVAGTGDVLVSGRATPRAFRFGRVTGEPVGGEAPPIPLGSLLELGRLAERLFGGPQDVEWVWRAGRFQLVQSRDITRLPGAFGGADAALEIERHAVLRAMDGARAGEIVFEQTEISELLPMPTTYSLALFQSLWEAGGTVDRTCRASGVPYEVSLDDAPMVRQVFGRCFVDARERRRRSARSLGAAASFRLATAAQRIEDEWRAALPAQQRRCRQLAAIDPARLPDDELLGLCEEVRAEFVGETYARAEAINVAAEYFVGAVRRRAGQAGRDAAALLRDPDGNVVGRAFARLRSGGTVPERVDAFLAAFGHRAVHDFELAEPRYGEDPAKVAAMAAVDAVAPPAPAADVDLRALPRLLAAAVQRARRFQALKEEAKHEATRGLAVLRGLLRAAGARFGLGDGIFDLTPEEVQALGRPDFRARAPELVRQRAAQRRALLRIDVPTALSAEVVERLGGAPEMRAASAGALAGACVAGSREVVGRVRVVEAPEELPTLRAGEILVTRCTDPCWLGAFGVAGGLITEIGGWLSHAAIQAREHDLPTIVGVPRATRALRTGDVVRLHRDGSVVLIPERRRPRQDVALSAALRLPNRLVPIRVLDLGSGGACIEVASPSQLPDTPFDLCVGDQVIAASFAWRNCQRAGVRFDGPRNAAAIGSILAGAPA